MSHIQTYARIKPSQNASNFYTQSENTIRVNVSNNSTMYNNNSIVYKYIFLKV